MVINRIIDSVNVPITLSRNELEQAYREQQHTYELEDAQRQLREYLGLNEEAMTEQELLENRRIAKSKYGIDIDSVFDENSPHYVLEDLVEKYKNTCNCNISENLTWETACESVLSSFREVSA